MSDLAFTDQKERLRRIVSNAVDGAAYEGSRVEENGAHLLIEARRPEGQLVSLRFRGVKDSEATAAPPPGSVLHLESVASARRFSLWSMLFFFLPSPGSNKMRVRIKADDARLDIVCEDAEWWED